MVASRERMRLIEYRKGELGRRKQECVTKEKRTDRKGIRETEKREDREKSSES